MNRAYSTAFMFYVRHFWLPYKDAFAFAIWMPYQHVPFGCDELLLVFLCDVKGLVLVLV